MDLDEYIQRVDETIAELEREIPILVAQFGQDLVDAISNRIQTTGRDADGQDFGAYTTGYIHFKKNPGNYKRGRDLGLASSRYVGHVDYSLTGEMWRNIGLVEESIDGNRIRLSYGGRNELTRTKLESLAKRDGDPLEPSEQELNEAQADFEASFERILSRIK